MNIDEIEEDKNFMNLQKLSLKKKLSQMAQKLQNYTADELQNVFRKSSTSSETEESQNQLSQDELDRLNINIKDGILPESE